MLTMTLVAAALLVIEMPHKKPHHLKPKKMSAKALDMGRHFAKISRAPLKKKGTSDAWNERQNRLTAGRDAAKLLIRGTKLKAQGK